MMDVEERSQAARPPLAGRTYWICQFAGWGGFATYIAGAYVVFAPQRSISVVAAILLFNGLGCPAATHALRYWMYRRHWLELPLRRFVLRAIAATLLLALVLAGGVVALELAVFMPTVDPAGAWWTFFAFAWAVAGWILVYRAVQARRRREREAFELTVLAREAQLSALRAQLNPHFLFNCLNSLRALIVQDPARAVTMVTALGDLLRYALASDRRQLVPLSEELAIVNQYLDLEKIRFEERLTVERAVDDAALGISVPPMLLQTLVDNAVKHGIATRPDGGVVRITARLATTHLDLAVASTGTVQSASGEGFGLQSVGERLRLLYQDRASLTLTSEGAATVATLRLPMEPA
jgi:two-component system LytT family sensor kinase